MSERQPNRESSLRRNLINALADGEWHSIGQLYVDHGVTISPEKSYRRLNLEQRRKYEGDPDRWIRRGRIQTMYWILRNLGCESRGFDWEREWRMSTTMTA